jgi:hypothetical protein
VHDSAEATIREGFALVARGCQEYRDGLEQARAILLDTDSRGGRRLIEDERVHEWHKFAQSVIRRAGRLFV